MIGSAFFCLVLVLFSLSTNFYLSLVLLTISGMGRVCFGVMQTSIILLTAADEMRSRVMGSLTIFIGAGLFVHLQAGALAEGFGAPLAVGVQNGVAIGFLGLILLLLSGYRRGRAGSEEWVGFMTRRLRRVPLVIFVAFRSVQLRQ